MSSLPRHVIAILIAKKKAQREAKRNNRVDAVASSSNHRQAQQRGERKGEGKRRNHGGGNDNGHGGSRGNNGRRDNGRDHGDDSSDSDDDVEVKWQGRRKGLWDCDVCDNSWYSIYTWMTLYTNGKWKCDYPMECKECESNGITTSIEEPTQHWRRRCRGCNEFFKNCTCHDDDDEEDGEGDEPDEHHMRRLCGKCQATGKLCSAGSRRRPRV